MKDETTKAGLTHVDAEGNARMVDVSGKPAMKRTAIAQGAIVLLPETVALLKEKALPKGDVLSTASIAAISAAKKTGELIPMCHPLGIDWVDVSFEVAQDRIGIQATVVTTEKTGVEMEALTAVSVAALTVYDMCKAVDKQMRIEDIYLVKKTKEAA